MPDTLQEWLVYIERQHPQAIEMELGRVREVYARIGLGRPGRRVITVAGTNGKGSTVAFIEAIARAAGLRTGAYTSPHLFDYRERVRIDGTDAGDGALVQAFAAVEAARGDTPLTYFEFGTLAALWLFERAELDLAILEVGLGGRLDATNLVDADVAVVTIGVGGPPDNLPPEATDDRLEVEAATPGTVDVLDNDTDPEGRPLGIDSWGQAEHGTVSCEVVCRYVPAPDYAGPDGFTYEVRDDRGLTAPGFVEVQVRPVEPPIITPSTVGPGGAAVAAHRCHRVLGPRGAGRHGAARPGARRPRGGVGHLRRARRGHRALALAAFHRGDRGR